MSADRKMEASGIKKGSAGPLRVGMMTVGILLIGMCVASYRMSGVGVDPFSCMNL